MANSNAFLPSSMDKADLLLDTEFCATLGVYPESGCCVRHPGIKIITKDASSEKIVSACQMCESEFLSEGSRQRQSFALEMMKVQKLHNDEHGWVEFKKNWDHGSRISMQSSETKDSEDGLNIHFQADAEHSDQPRRLDLYSPSSILRRTNKHQVAWKEYTWQVILRTTQVQEWAIAEKDKEIELLRKKLKSFSDLPANNDSLTEITSMAAPSASEDTISLYEDNPTYTQTIAEEAPPRVPHRRSSSRFAAQNADSGAVADQPNGVRPPRRQISNDLFEFDHGSEGDEEESEDSDDPEMHRQTAGTSHNSNRGSGRLNHRLSKYQARVPPTLPTRQASNEGLMKTSVSSGHNPRSSNVSALSELTAPSMFSSSMDSLLFQESDRNLDMTGTFQVTGMEHTELQKKYPSYKSKSSSKRSSNYEIKSLDTIQSEEFVLDRQISSNSIQRVDEITPLSGNHLKQSIPASLPEHAVIAGEEISYIASVMEEPPPPPPTREDSIQFPLPASREYEIPLNGGSSSYQDIRFQGSQQDVKMEASQDIKFDASQQDITFDASQDIRFDASQDIRFDASSSSLHPADDRFFRRSSIAEMQFSDKDKLLQEASQAFSTPQYITKKLRSQDVRRMSAKSKPASFHLASIDQLASSDGPEPDRSNVRPASADDVMLKRPPSNLILSPSSAQIPSQLSTPPREKQPMKLGDFLEQNHDGNESDEPEMAEFGDLPVNRGFLRLDGGSSSPVSCVTMLTTEPTSMIGGSMDDDEDLEPNIGLSDGGARRLLPMEEGFNSDEESSSSSEDSEIATPRPTIDVVDQIVNDQYGDSGLYTGRVTADGRIPHGRGVMMYENEREYNGDWSDGRWHGQGEWVNPNGDRYNGTFVFDSRHGEGTYSWRNGNTYKGEFFEDKRQGKGVFTFANGNVYEGDFINGVFEGEGKYTFGNGFYRGSWRGGKYHGIGFLQFNDGSSYSGTFVEGVAHGEGKEISSEGKITTGFWDQGVAPDR